MYKKVLIILVIVLVTILLLAIYLLNHAKVTVHHGAKQEILNEDELKEQSLIEISPVDLNAKIKNIEKPTLVLFWATWCMPCKSEIAQIERFKSIYDFDTYYVCCDKNNEKQTSVIKSTMHKYNMKYSYVIPNSFSLDFTNENNTKKYIKEFANIDDVAIPYSIFYNDKSIVLYSLKGFNPDSIKAYNFQDSLFNYHLK